MVLWVSGAVAIWIGGVMLRRRVVDGGGLNGVADVDPVDCRSLWVERSLSNGVLINNVTPTSSK